MIYFTMILVFIVRIITIDNSKSFGLSLYRFESDENEFKKNKEVNKFLILSMNIVIQMLSFFYNKFINRFFDWSEEGILIK